MYLGKKSLELNESLFSYLPDNIVISKKILSKCPGGNLILHRGLKLNSNNPEAKYK